MRGEETRGRYREGGEKSVGAFSERLFDRAEKERQVNRARDGGGEREREERR